MQVLTLGLSILRTRRKKSAMKTKMHSIHLIKLDSFTSEMVSDLTSQLVKQTYSDSTGIGFDEVLFDGEYLSAILFKRTPTFIPQYDIATGKIVDQEIFIFSRIIWGIDTKYSTLEIIGPARNAKKLLSAISPFFDSSIQISPIDLSPNKVLTTLIDHSLFQEIQKLTLNNFQYREGIIGRYEMRVSNSQAAAEIVKMYPKEVSKAKLLLTLPEIGTTIASFSKDGHIEVLCKEDEVLKILSILKIALFDNKNGGIHA